MRERCPKGFGQNCGENCVGVQSCGVSEDDALAQPGVVGYESRKQALIARQAQINQRSIRWTDESGGSHTMPLPVDL